MGSKTHAAGSVKWEDDQGELGEGGKQRSEHPNEQYNQHFHQHHKLLLSDTLAILGVKLHVQFMEYRVNAASGKMHTTLV